MEKVRTFTFVVPGKPMSSSPNFEDNRKCWDSARQHRFNFGMSVKKQFYEQSKDGQLPINGTVELLLHFFLAPIPLKKLNTHSLKPHEELPKLSDLERFVENQLSKIVFTKTYKISKINSEKTYDKDPRTVITVIIREQ